jgi:hypothetical protein
LPPASGRIPWWRRTSLLLGWTAGLALACCAGPSRGLASDFFPEVVPLAPSDSIPIGLPAVIEPEPGVADPVFGLLVGLVESGVYGTLTGERLQKELDRVGKPSRLPYHSLTELTRIPAIPGRTALVPVTFKGGLDLPVPYSILGYHPGSFRASENCVFREWMFPRFELAHQQMQDGKIVQKILVLEDVHLFGLQEGKVKIDIDGWLDALMGDALDDTDVTCLMLCRYQGKWYGFAMGYSNDGGGRSGAFAFDKDEIIFPSTPEMRTIGREMRRRKELLMPSWQAPTGRFTGAAAAPGRTE